MQINTITSWIVRGLGGAANMLSSLVADKIPLDGDQLKQLRSIVVQLASHYNYHAKRSAMEPHENPPFWGADYPVGGMGLDGQLDPTQPLPVVSEPSGESAGQPADASSEPTGGASS